MSLVYSQVSRGTDVLATHAETELRFEQLGLQYTTCSERSEGTSRRVEGDYVLHFTTAGVFTYLVVSEVGCPYEICDYFLASIEQEFVKRHIKTGSTCQAHALDHKFGKRMRLNMQVSMKNADKISKMYALQTNVDDVKLAMAINIQLMMERGEKVDDLQARASDLEKQADEFRAQGKKLMDQLWWKKAHANATAAAAGAASVAAVAVPLIILL